MKTKMSPLSLKKDASLRKRQKNRLRHAVGSFFNIILQIGMHKILRKYKAGQCLENERAFPE